LIFLPLLFRCVYLFYPRANVALFFLTLILLVRYRLIALLLLTGTTNERVSDSNHVDIRSFMLQLADWLPIWLLLTFFTDSLTDHNAVLEIVVLSTVLSCTLLHPG
jgi:hypothetical protein